MLQNKVESGQEIMIQSGYVVNGVEDMRAVGITNEKDYELFRFSSDYNEYAGGTSSVNVLLGLQNFESRPVY